MDDDVIKDNHTWFPCEYSFPSSLPVGVRVTSCLNVSVSSFFFSQFSPARFFPQSIFGHFVHTFLYPSLHSVISPLRSFHLALYSIISPLRSFHPSLHLVISSVSWYLFHEDTRWLSWGLLLPNPPRPQKSVFHIFWRIKKKKKKEMQDWFLLFFLFDFFLFFFINFFFIV